MNVEALGGWISTFLCAGFFIRICVGKSGCLHSECVTNLSQILPDGKSPMNSCLSGSLSEAL